MNVLCQKCADELRDFRSILFQSEVSGVQQMQFRAGCILQERLRARLGKYRIVLTPDNQYCRLLLAQVLVPRRIEWRVVAVVIKKSELDLVLAWLLWFAKTLADFEINDVAALPPLF